MAPVNASFSPTVWSSNFGQRMPGVSSRSSAAPILIHCFARVTPGLSAAFALTAPARRLMRDDLPTFGMPRIMQRAARGRPPFLTKRSVFGRASSSAFATSCFMPRPLTESMATAGMPCARKYASQRFVLAESARSDLLSAIRRGFSLMISASIGLALLAGMRASSSSMTTSTSFRFSSISRCAFFIWPGNHWIPGRSFLVSFSMYLPPKKILLPL